MHGLIAGPPPESPVAFTGSRSMDRPLKLLGRLGFVTSIAFVVGVVVAKRAYQLEVVVDATIPAGSCLQTFTQPDGAPRESCSNAPTRHQFVHRTPDHRLTYLRIHPNWNGATSVLHEVRVRQGTRELESWSPDDLRKWSWLNVTTTEARDDGIVITPANAYPYMALLLVGKHLVNNAYWGVHLMNLGLGVAAIIVFRRLYLATLGARSGKAGALLATLLLAVNPLFVISALNTNFDFPVAVVGLAFLEACLARRARWAAVMGLLLCFAKVTGAMHYFVFLALFALLSPWLPGRALSVWAKMLCVVPGVVYTGR